MLNPNEQLKGLAKDGNDQNLIETFYILMKTFGYTLDELKALPIPTFNFLIKMMEKENELKKKSYRRKR